jgi:hypothetical protein
MRICVRHDSAFCSPPGFEKCRADDIAQIPGTGKPQACGSSGQAPEWRCSFLRLLWDPGTRSRAFERRELTCLSGVQPVLKSGKAGRRNGQKRRRPDYLSRSAGCIITRYCRRRLSVSPILDSSADPTRAVLCRWLLPGLQSRVPSCFLNNQRRQRASRGSPRQ